MDEVTLVLATVGAVLGIVNTWHDLNQTRVRLRVVPKIAYPFNMSDNRPRICIDIVNLSPFPVTVSQVGFTLDSTEERLVVTDPVVIDGGRFPRRLDAREAFTVYLSPGVESSASFRQALRAFAETQTGDIKYSRVASVRRLKGS